MGEKGEQMLPALRIYDSVAGNPVEPARQCSLGNDGSTQQGFVGLYEDILGKVEGQLIIANPARYEARYRPLETKKNRFKVRYLQYRDIFGIGCHRRGTRSIESHQCSHRFLLHEIHRSCQFFKKGRVSSITPSKE